MALNLSRYFDEAFSKQCVLTNHALQRIEERFLYAELGKLKLLVQAALRVSPLEKWVANEETVIIDPRFNFSMLCVHVPEKNLVKVITFIRGKTPEAYKDCKTIVVSILKEKCEQEVQQLKKHSKMLH